MSEDRLRALYGNFDVQHRTRDELMATARACESGISRTAAQIVQAFMLAKGITQLEADDENSPPCYQRDYEDEELDLAVAWLPRGICRNSTPGGGWNPVIRLQEINEYLEEKK